MAAVRYSFTWDLDLSQIFLFCFLQLKVLWVFFVCFISMLYRMKLRGILRFRARWSEAGRGRV